MNSRILMQIVCVLIAFSITAPKALAWGPGVHAYIGDQIAKKAGWKNVNEMYGAMAPDVMNYMFYSPYLQEMYIATHFDFEPLWDAARTPQERTLALGFLMHNNAWAADYTAHTASLSLPDHTKGYVIQKAEQLAVVLESDPDYSLLGIPHEVTLEICHNMIENSVELLMAQVDRKLGKKVVEATRERGNSFPRLLVRAYSPLFAQYFNNSEEQAALALVNAESVFRQITMAQGLALQQRPAVALDQIAELNVQLAEGFLAQYGIELPEGFDTKGLITTLIVAGMQLCQDDFEREIDATVRAVKENLVQNGYRYPQY
jgi:hypothetical protein